MNETVFFGTIITTEGNHINIQHEDNTISSILLEGAKDEVNKHIHNTITQLIGKKVYIIGEHKGTAEEGSSIINIIDIVTFKGTIIERIEKWMHDNPPVVEKVWITLNEDTTVEGMMSRIAAMDEAIFNPNCIGVKFKGIECPVKMIGARGHLRSIDVNGIRYVDQNEDTNTEYAKKKKAGHKIMWAIRIIDGFYMGHTEDGVWEFTPNAIRILDEESRAKVEILAKSKKFKEEITAKEEMSEATAVALEVLAQISR